MPCFYIISSKAARFTFHTGPLSRPASSGRRREALPELRRRGRRRMLCGDAAQQPQLRPPPLLRGLLQAAHRLRHGILRRALAALLVRQARRRNAVPTAHARRLRVPRPPLPARRRHRCRHQPLRRHPVRPPPGVWAPACICSRPVCDHFVSGRNAPQFLAIEVKSERLRLAEPGQYFFLRIPSVARLQWHPFSVCSAPEDEHISIVLKDLGEWTHALCAAPSRHLPRGGRIRLDGPYGRLTGTPHRFLATPWAHHTITV
jgi:hypothetical protein